MTAHPTGPDHDDPRTQTIAGLRVLADFLEANPAIPISASGGECNVFANRTDDQTERAEIDIIAAVLGEPVQDGTHDGGDYCVTKEFGLITYHLTHVPARRRALYRAHSEFAQSVFDTCR